MYDFVVDTTPNLQIKHGLPLNAIIILQKLAPKNKISVTLDPKSKKVRIFWKVQHTLTYPNLRVSSRGDVILLDECNIEY